MLLTHDRHFAQPTSGATDVPIVHDLAFRIAVELLGGRELRFVDEHGRRWSATSTCLAWNDAAVIEGSAYDIAIEAARRAGERVLQTLSQARATG